MKTLTFEEVKANVKEAFADWKNNLKEGIGDCFDSSKNEEEIQELDKCEDTHDLINFFYFIDFDNPEEFIFDCIIDG
jgi:hypothetical protein